jgi:hypothetical protein
MHHRQSYYESYTSNNSSEYILNSYIGKNINDFLIKNRKAIYNVNGDGHCILNAILCCLNYEGEMITLDDMKRKLIRFAYDNKEKYSQFMINTKPIEFYHAFLEYINEKNWQDDIGDLILTIVNEAFNIESNIFNVEYDTIMSVNAIKNGQPDKRPYHRINLCKRASHYDAIVTWSNSPSSGSIVYSYTQHPNTRNQLERGNYFYDQTRRHNSLVSSRDKLVNSCVNCKRKMHYFVDQFGLPVQVVTRSNSGYNGAYLKNNYYTQYDNNNNDHHKIRDRRLW